MHSLPEGATGCWGIHSYESADALGSLSFTYPQNVLHNKRERESSSDTATRIANGCGTANKDQLHMLRTTIAGTNSCNLHYW